MKSTFLIVGLFFHIYVSVHAQTQPTNTDKKIDVAQKKSLQPEDYKQWGRMHSSKISDTGEWYSYVLSYKHDVRMDTLSVHSTKKDVGYHFSSKWGEFGPGGKWFSCLASDKGERGLILLHMETGKTQRIPDVDRFEFSKDGRYLIGFGKTENAQMSKSNLWIMDLEQGKKESIQGVTEYALDQTSGTLAYIVDSQTEKAVRIKSLKLFSRTSTITSNTLYPYKKLVWNSQGTALGFLQQLPEAQAQQKVLKIHYYDTGKAILHGLDSTLNDSLLPEKYIVDNHLMISEDGKRVFFRIQDPKNQEKATGPSSEQVQVWKTTDKRIYPKRQNNRFWEHGPKLAGWWPHEDKILQLETDSLPKSDLINGGTHMLSYNPSKYGSRFRYKADIDLYITNLETGRCQLLLKRMEYGKFGTSPMRVSPGGKYITYFKYKHWWVYDMAKRTHINMTKDLAVPLQNTENAFPNRIESYGIAGWTKGDERLLVYDQYDVWAISPKGKAPQKLTRGRENKVTYRIEQLFMRPIDQLRYYDGQEFDLSKGLVFHTRGQDKASGYSLWKQGKPLEQMVFKDMHLSTLKKVQDKEVYMYTEQRFDVAPRICYWEKGMSHPKILKKTNIQQDRYLWGHAELIHYMGPNGQPLQGALFYPANYKAGKKYPMVVKIYEKLSVLLHRYENPTEYDGAGFNHTSYTSNGYLVFFPDIRYRFNDPGVSAVRCVESGVKAVLAKGIVEKDRIGLIGHSFGGYEAAFVASQSDLFTTVVAGAANTDLVSAYHSVAWGDGDQSRVYWFEDQQWRFSDSFYKNPEAYLRNSTIHHAANINIPLLLWTGGRDARIDWQQSIELYSGLRRLGKDCTLLLYPDEGHQMDKVKNKVDLTRRIKAWFDGYLKAEKTD